MYLPKKIVLTSGYGVSDTELNSFDNALINAGINDFNLVKVSSIAPKGFSFADSNFLKNLKRGTVLHCILARYTTKLEENIASAICLLKTNDIGLITEYSGACTEKYAREMVLKMAETMCSQRSLKKEEVYFTSIEYKAKKQFSTVISACILV
ncbi:arginine decarboxylase, pyruvoyl-dependent [Thermococci archaeon]|nr:MAG: arginine decarboxylase, pyruvoyl-dependent [Thermococci archaeon]